MKQSNNNGKKNTKKDKNQEFDLKLNSYSDLYNIAQQRYQILSQKQQSKWHDIISRGGTKKDKIGFMAAEIIKNPHTSLQQFQELSKWCFDKNHHFAIDAIRALVNIFNEYVFIQKQSLKIFYDQIQQKIKESKKKCIATQADLIGYYLEHNIKHFYSELVRSIQQLLQSNITFVKKTAISLLAVLTKHAELRRMIINTLINKLGDSDMEIVNETYKSLKSQFYQDLQSSYILLEESQTFLFRQNISRKSQFYVINFLNNLNMKFLTEKGLSKLFELFYHFFQKLMGDDNKQGSVSSRLFLNSIKGLNKIFGFIKGGNRETKDMISSKIESVYKIVHTTTNIKAKIQLYLFLFQFHSHIHGNLTDRFYRSLYEFIGKPDILHCSLAQLFFDLVLISLKQDQNLNRVQAFIKRMLQLCLTAQANFVVTTLIMIGKVMEEKEALRIVLQKIENHLAEDGDQSKKYDPSKRQPIYAGAQNTLIWELTIFTSHFHPTVRKYATHLIHGQQIPYDGTNPMLQLSTTSFLEKLVLKKERKSDAWKLKVKKNLNKIRRSKYETLLDKAPENFKEDEQFIQKYLEQRSLIHNNFKKRQTTDIQEFADQVIERQMDRLNPHDLEGDLSLSQEQLGDEEGNGDFDDEEGEENPENQFQDDEFGSDQVLEDDFDDEEGGQQDQFDDDQMIDQDQEEQQSESQEKQFEEVFNEIGDDDDDFPRKKAKGKQNLRSGKTGNNRNGRKTHQIGKKSFKSKGKRR